jgi:hypothetical protein
MTELAEQERVTVACVCRLLPLNCLAPDIVEAILDGRPTAGLAQFLKPFPVEWERQREHLLNCGRDTSIVSAGAGRNQSRADYVSLHGNHLVSD